MIHCLPPRSPDEAAAARWTGDVVVPAPVRAKLTVLANRVLAAFCAETGIPFIDTWAELTESGYLRPEFELDGFHLNRQAALVSLDRIAANLFDQTAGTWNASRYRHALNQAALG